jgi:hypothetical protein
MTKKRIIAVAGLIGSGKDTVANYLTNHHGFMRMSFASSLKDAVSVIFGWPREMLEGVTKTSREWREQQDEWWSNRLGMNITPRWVLQNWGTEVLRHHFHDHIWIASLEYRLLHTKDDIVITDARFKNEIDAIKRLGGITTRIVRGPAPEWYEAAVSYNRGERGNMTWALSRSKLETAGIHASEYSSVGLDYDCILTNDGTIDELNQQINSLLQSHPNAR